MTGRLAAIALLIAVMLACAIGPAAAKPTRKLYLLNWSQYMAPSIIKAFEKRYNVDVVQSYFESNPQLFAKLRAGGARQFDVIVPSNYYVPRLIHSHLIQPLDRSLVPNLDNLKPRFSDPPYDPNSRYTAAYQWGTTGIAYNSHDLPQGPESWSILFDESINSRHPFAIGSDAQVMIGAACAYQGHGYDCRGRRHWKQAAMLLQKTRQRENFSGFVAGTSALRQLARGTIDAGVTFNGDYAFDRKRSPEAFAHIDYVLPKEGAELWVDTMAIPAHAPHPRLANAFINFILRAKIGAQLSNYNHYATPNAKAQPLLDPSLQKPPVSPTPQQMKRLRFTPSLAGWQFQFVQQLWTEIKSR